MKKVVFSLAVCLLCLGAQAQPESGPQQTILLSGASFASPNNGWFEFGCQSLGAGPLNRAVSGTSIADCAERMHAGTLYTPNELEHIEALVIMHVHDRNVFDDPDRPLRGEYSDYPFPFDRGHYAGAFDYVIKKYMADCYALRLDKGSQWYGKPSGKPAVIVLCTHWHDSRTVFNASVRLLAAKWGLPLVEFDRLIGFSNQTPHPVTGQQHSLLYAADTQVVGGVAYGWHPFSGDTYIQRRMAAIFADTMRQILPL